MKKISAILSMLLAVMACSKEHVNVGTDRTLTISAGYEEYPDSRTYIKDPSAGTIWWGTSGVDKVLFVFDQSGTKNVLTSQSGTAEAVRTFSSDSWSGGDWSYAVWTGYSQAKDQCALNGSVLSGPTLMVQNPQIITNSQSFNNSANNPGIGDTDIIRRHMGVDIGHTALPFFV